MNLLAQHVVMILTSSMTTILTRLVETSTVVDRGNEPSGAVVTSDTNQFDSEMDVVVMSDTNQ
jgi:hypothetical protein